MRRRKGFTLLELTVTAFLLGAVMTLMVQFLAVIAAQRRGAERRTTAILEVGNLMEAFTARGFESVTTESARSLSLSEQARDALPDAELSIDVSEEGKRPVAKRVALALRWKDRAGRFVAPTRLTAWLYRSKKETP